MKRNFLSFSPPKSAGKENKSRWKSHFQCVPLDLVENSTRFPRSFFIPVLQKTVPINWTGHPIKDPAACTISGPMERA